MRCVDLLIIVLRCQWIRFVFLQLRLEWHKENVGLPAGEQFFRKSSTITVEDDGLAYHGRILKVYQEVDNGTYWYDVEFPSPTGFYSADEKVVTISNILCCCCHC